MLTPLNLVFVKARNNPPPPLSLYSFLSRVSLETWKLNPQRDETLAAPPRGKDSSSPPPPGPASKDKICITLGAPHCAAPGQWNEALAEAFGNGPFVTEKPSN
ncbi:hypothetical protein LguiA_027017 [Lonicera macranthoides]